MRLLNLVVAAALVLAAGYVYKSKFAATVEAERVAKLRAEITRERDLIAALRAEAAKLEAPARIQGLTQRHLPLRPLDLNQIATIDAIPFPPTEVIAPPGDEPEIATTKPAAADLATGSIHAPAPAAAPASSHTPSPAPRKPAAPVATVRRAPAAPSSAATRPDPMFAPPRPPAEVSTGGMRATTRPR